MAITQAPIQKSLFEFSENDSDRVRAEKLTEITRQQDNQIRELQIAFNDLLVRFQEVEDIVNG